MSIDINQALLSRFTTVVPTAVETEKPKKKEPKEPKEKKAKRTSAYKHFFVPYTNNSLVDDYQLEHMLIQVFNDISNEEDLDETQLLELEDIRLEVLAPVTSYNNFSKYKTLFRILMPVSLNALFSQTLENYNNRLLLPLKSKPCDVHIIAELKVTEVEQYFDYIHRL